MTLIAIGHVAVPLSIQDIVDSDNVHLILLFLFISLVVDSIKNMLVTFFLNCTFLIFCPKFSIPTLFMTMINVRILPLQTIPFPRCDIRFLILQSGASLIFPAWRRGADKFNASLRTRCYQDEKWRWAELKPSKGWWKRN